MGYGNDIRAANVDFQTKHIFNDNRYVLTRALELINLQLGERVLTSQETSFFTNKWDEIKAGPRFDGRIQFYISHNEINVFRLEGL